MKKIVLIMLTPLLFLACSSYQSLDLSRLTTGMTKAEVISQVGRPNRVLAVNDTRNGYQEVLEYRTGRDEIYALEFWNDFLTGYEFLYDDYTYVPPVAPPFWYPDYYGRPIVVYPPSYYPNRPNRPGQTNRPGYPNRPSEPSLPSRPETNRPTRPTPPTRPETERPNRQDLTRPTPGVGTNTNTNTGTGSSGTTTRPINREPR